ncbi:MAG TPA: isocitrate/isopropylmalate family dehydrogenase, partial [Acidimicrobiia bacterium]|nr:isocitrate/isopropylmalate family dehydrogenase [Acidimicrobiia bacterium]
QTSYSHIDAACIYFVQDPARFDVIVTDNLFGDILTDLGGAISGGIGRAASGNLNPAKNTPSMFEPVHGSAPDISGKNLADPRAAIISAVMMCEFLGENEVAKKIRLALEETDDFVGLTTETGDKIAKACN